MKHQKKSPWSVPYAAIKKLFNKSSGTTANKLNPFMLAKEQNDIFNLIRSKIKCSVDKKTNLITIVVEDQGPLVAATVSNQASEQLKDFISTYRTSKAHIEYDKKLTVEAEKEYERARQLYGSYADANTDVLLESFKLKQEDLKNDMQLYFNNYSTLNTQLQAAKARVQEKTPVFTSVACSLGAAETSRSQAHAVCSQYVFYRLFNHNNLCVA